jgi:hypothetical protein
MRRTRTINGVARTKLNRYNWQLGAILKIPEHEKSITVGKFVTVQKFAHGTRQKGLCSFIGCLNVVDAATALRRNLQRKQCMEST